MRRVVVVANLLVLVYACTSEGPERQSSSAGGSGGTAGRGGTAGDTAAGGSGDQGGESSGGAQTGGSSGTSGNGSGASGGVGGTQGGSAGKAGASGNGGASGAGAGGGSSGSSAMGGEGGETPVDFPDPVTVDPFSSGSRLRAKYYAGSDGSKHYIGLYDTVLAGDCEFANLGADGYRCVPRPFRESDHEVYATNECSLSATAIGYEVGCGVSAYHVRNEPEDVCDGMPRRLVRELGDLLPDAAFIESGEDCTSYGVGVQYYSYFETAPTDVTVFASGTLEDVDLGEGLSLLLVNGEEGSRYPQTLWFAGQPCATTSITGAGHRCLPPQSLSVMPSYFTEDTCTNHLGIFSASQTACDPPPRFATQGNAECGDEISIVEVTPYTGPTYVDLDQCSANPGPPSPDVARFSIGDTVDPDTLPALSQDLSGPRLQRSVITTANGSSIAFTSAIYDNQLGRACTPEVFEDDVIRCMPSALSLNQFYADAGCTVPVYPETELFCPDDREEYRAEVIGDQNCSQRRTIGNLYRVGAEYTGDLYLRSFEGDCTANEGLGYDAFYSLDPVDLNELVTLTIEVE